LTPTLILLLKSWQAGHKPAALAIWQQATVPTRVVFEYITVNKEDIIQSVVADQITLHDSCSLSHIPVLPFLLTHIDSTEWIDKITFPDNRFSGNTTVQCHAFIRKCSDFNLQLVTHMLNLKAYICEETKLHNINPTWSFVNRDSQIFDHCKSLIQ
jgi:hypothetical protein